MYGIEWYNSSGTIQNNVIWRIADPAAGSANGRSIRVIDDDGNGKASAVTIKNNLISRYQTMGIDVSGQVKATITGNHLDGLDGASVSMPGYGILVAPTVGVPTGIISRNLLLHHYSAIYLRDVSGMSSTGSTIVDTGFNGVYVESNCFVAG